MEDRRTHSRVRPEERLVIASMRLQGASTRATAGVLARPASTVSREIRRNATAEGEYSAHSAMTQHASRCQAARCAGKLDLQSRQCNVVVTMLSWNWSPQQIAATLQGVFPDQPERHVSPWRLVERSC